MTLGEVNITEDNFDTMAEHVANMGILKYAYVPLEKEDVINIFKICM